MTRKKLTKLEIATRGGIAEEMAKPRTAMSARIAELKWKTLRNRELPITIVLGEIDKIIPTPRKSRPEKAPAAVTIPEKHRVGGLRVGNALIGERGRVVKLKKGSAVEMPVIS